MDIILTIPILVSFYGVYRLGRIEGAADMKDKLSTPINSLLDQVSKQKDNINRLENEIKRWRTGDE